MGVGCRVPDTLRPSPSPYSLAVVAETVEAGAAIHRLVTPREERDLCLCSTLGANGWIHLSRRAYHSAPPASGRVLGHPLRLACSTTFLAARRFVQQSLQLIELLLASRENELSPALTTPKSLVHEAHPWDLLLPLDLIVRHAGGHEPLQTFLVGLPQSEYEPRRAQPKARPPPGRIYNMLPIDAIV